MKKTILLLLFAATAAAQTPEVVTSARFLEWDHDAESAAITDEYRLYLSRSPGVVPDGTPDHVVTALEWAIVAAPGRWHVVVTAYDVESDTESASSNELTMIVFGGPTLLRVRPVP